MPQLRIAILTAGGTIDKDYSCDLGGYNFEVGEPAVKRLFAMLRGIRNNFV